MHDDDALCIEFDPPDPDVVYEHYLETCRRAGVTPIQRDRADALVEESSDAFARALMPPTTY